jgi:hypothetical protein
LVAGVPERFAELLAGRDATLRHPDLEWNAVGYVCHVTDNLRIWAERLAGAALGGTRDVRGYDADLLARARGYNRMGVEAALWSLGRAVETWLTAVEFATPLNTVLMHSARGEQRVDHIIRNNAHDAFHHAWDIQRSLEN